MDYSFRSDTDHSTSPQTPLSLTIENGPHQSDEMLEFRGPLFTVENLRTETDRTRKHHRMLLVGFKTDRYKFYSSYIDLHPDCHYLHFEIVAMLYQDFVKMGVLI